MAKNAVYGLINVFDEEQNNELKKLSILFEKIYIVKDNNVASDFKDEGGEIKGYDYLEKNGIIQSYRRIIHPEGQMAELSDLLKDIDKMPIKTYKGVGFEKISKGMEDVYRDLKVVKDKLNFMFFNNDNYVRVEAPSMGSDFFPILKSSQSFSDSGIKGDVMQFLLDQIPEPDSSVAWEHIIEFRSDESVMNKYYALILWVNKVAASSGNISDIQDEYRSLYSDYMQAFKLHKMKYGNRTIEIIVTVGDSFTSSLLKGKIFSAIHGLLDIRAAKLNLLEEEGKLPGKEIAYIYHANKKFKNV